MAKLSRYKLTDTATNKFYKFCNPDNWRGESSYNLLNAWIATNKAGTVRKLMVAGYSQGYGISLGDGMQQNAGGFEPVNLNDPANPLEPGEMIEEFYLSSHCWFYLTNYGNLFSCGYNGYGQLGIGSTTTSQRFRKITTFNKNVAKFAVSQGTTSYEFCYAITKTGQLYAWGYNGYGNLGISGNTTNQTTPQLISGGSISGKTIIAVHPISETYTSYSMGFVIDSDRNVHVVGYNSTGMLGVGSAGSTLNTGFQQVPTIKGDKIIGGSYNATGTAYVLDKVNGIIYGSGYNGYYQFSDGTTTNRSTFGQITMPVGRTVTDIWSGNIYCSSIGAILDDGSIRTWGYNVNGIRGNGTTTDASPLTNPNTANNPNPNGAYTSFGIDRKVIKGRICAHSSPSSHVLTDDGRIYGAGYNGHGIQGTGAASDTYYWEWATHPYGLKFVDFEVWGQSSSHGITAIDEQGDIWCMGYNGNYSCAHPDRGAHTCYLWRQAHIKGRG